jgi:hypothetical protein
MVNFTVVINPFNGPGLDAIPDLCYQREIPILASFDNVYVVGYIHTSYASRDMGQLRKEIETYSQWKESSGVPGLAVEGLFVDEVPWQYDVKVASYLQNITASVGQNKGFGSRSKVSMLWFQPGQICFLESYPRNDQRSLANYCHSTMILIKFVPAVLMFATRSY